MGFGSEFKNLYIQIHCTDFQLKLCHCSQTNGGFACTKVVIDLPFVSFYNIIMKISSAGFFRPDHDPPVH